MPRPFTPPLCFFPRPAPVRQPPPFCPPPSWDWSSSWAWFGAGGRSWRPLRYDHTPLLLQRSDPGQRADHRSGDDRFPVQMLNWCHHCDIISCLTLLVEQSSELEPRGGSGCHGSSRHSGHPQPNQGVSWKQEVTSLQHTCRMTSATADAGHMGHLCGGTPVCSRGSSGCSHKSTGSPAAGMASGSAPDPLQSDQ